MEMWGKSPRPWWRSPTGSGPEGLAGSTHELLAQPDMLLSSSRGHPWLMLLRVRRGGVGGGGENPSWAIVSIKKRQSVPGRGLSALELLLGKERGEKERKAKGMKEGGKAGGRISGLMVLKASLNVNLCL